MITIEDIQQRLADAISMSKLSQTEIAQYLKIQPTQICSYKKGRKMPSLETFANLCAVLHLDANEILCLDTFD